MSATDVFQLSTSAGPKPEANNKKTAQVIFKLEIWDLTFSFSTRVT